MRDRLRRRHHLLHTGEHRISNLLSQHLGKVHFYLQGGQWVLSLVDHYAASFVVFVLASLEVTGVFWIYGLENLLDDIEFMLHMRPSFYWRICWAIVTPLFLIGIFLYWIVNFTPLMYSDTLSYPPSAHGKTKRLSIILAKLKWKDPLEICDTRDIFTENLASNFFIAFLLIIWENVRKFFLKPDEMIKYFSYVIFS